MHSAKRHTLLPFFTIFAIGVLFAIGGIYYFLNQRSRPLKPAALGEETRFPVHLEQKSPDGTITLEEIWLYENTPRMLRISGHFTGPDPNEKYYVSSRIREERNGFENGGYSWYSGTGKAPDSQQTHFVLEYAGFPVAAEKYYVRVYFRDKQRATEVAAINEFEIVNPFPRPSGKWTAAPLPATHKVDPLEVTLTKVETGFTDPKTGPTFRDSFSRAYLRVAEQGVPSKGWSVWSIRFATASGLSFGSGRKNLNAGGDVDYLVDGTLWKCEGPWRLQVTLMRWNDFHPDEIIELPELDVPAEKQIAQSDLKWNVAGADIRFLGLTGGGVKLPEWGPEKASPEISFYFQIPPENPGYYLRFLSITDETGHEYLDGEQYGSGYAHGRPFCVALAHTEKRPQKLRCRVGVVFDRRETEFVTIPTFTSEKYAPVPDQR